MIDSTLELVVVPIKVQLGPLRINPCSVVIFELISQRSYTEDVHWRSRKENNIFDLDSV